MASSSTGFDSLASVFSIEDVRPNTTTTIINNSCTRRGIKQCKAGLTKSDVLYVISVVSNPRRYKRRYELARKFAEHMASFDKQIVFYMVEAAYGDRPFEVTDAFNPRHIRLHVPDRSEIWLKESLINYGVSCLPCDWKYVAWIDADITFTNPNWAKETIQQLQCYPFVQLFQNCCDLGPDNETLQLHQSFGYNWIQKISGNPAADTTQAYPDTKWHPGYAWACTAEAWEALGGMPDFAILGSGDHHLAMALIGRVEETAPSQLRTYKKMLVAMQKRIKTALHGDLLGYVAGTINHWWHGCKRNRQYIQRWDVLKKHKYDPIEHTHRNSQGILTLNPGYPDFQSDLRAYFVQRHEDSKEL